jgi:hypothetical protein
MKTKSKTTFYAVDVVAAAMLLTGQISFAGSATWLSSPQDSAWENLNNWTAGGPPNGPSDVATFAQTSQREVNVSTSVQANSIVFTSDSAAFTLNISPFCPGCPNVGGELVLSGPGISNTSNVLQTFEAGGAGRIIFNASSAASAGIRISNYSADERYVGGKTIFNDTSSAGSASIGNSSGELGGGNPGETIFNDASTADQASISNYGAALTHGSGGDTVFNGTSTAANASIHNGGTDSLTGGGGYTIFNDASTAGHATITNDASGGGGYTIFFGTSTADGAILIANGGIDSGGSIGFADASTGGTARVKVFDNGDLNIYGHQGGVTIGSLEGSGNVFLGANRLTVGTNGINTSFSGAISDNGQGGLLSKVGSGVLTLQTNHCIAATVGLVLVSGSMINLNFNGPPDLIASLKVNGAQRSPGIYGGPISGAPNILPEFAGSGTVKVAPGNLGNISTRAFVQTGDNVMIGGFIVQGNEPKRVIIRAIGPELIQYLIPNPLYNPTLELHDHTGALIASNDNWRDTIIGGIITEDQAVDIRDSGYEPADGRESAMIVSLPAGNYTAIVRGINGTTGVALVEVYDLSPTPASILGNISTRSLVQTGNDVMIGGFIIEGERPKEGHCACDWS